MFNYSLEAEYSCGKWQYNLCIFKKIATFTISMILWTLDSVQSFQLRFCEAHKVKSIRYFFIYSSFTTQYVFRYSDNVAPQFPFNFLLLSFFLLIFTHECKNIFFNVNCYNDNCKYLYFTTCSHPIIAT